MKHNTIRSERMRHLNSSKIFPERDQTKKIMPWYEIGVKFHLIFPY